MSPKVSVIIPVYNAQEYLGQCLDTILLQTLQDIEVICVDDGSTDESLSLLNTYAMLDYRLKVIHQENAGAAAARNRGLQEATGEFISVLDADDFFETDMLEKMVAKAEQDGSDVVICGHYIFDNNIKQVVNEVKIEERFLQKSPCMPEDFKEELFAFCDTATWNKLIRTRIIKLNNLACDRRVRYVDDVYFTSCVLACAEQISITKDTYVYHRINVSTQQTQFRKNYFADSIKTLSLLYDTLLTLHGNKFLNPLLLRCRKLITWMLNACPSDLKHKNLMTLRTGLPKDLFEKLFAGYQRRIAVSIIIPVYNAAEFLPECLDSCLNQTLKAIEIICVDDGSTDNSLEILNEYAQRDKRIIVLQQKNQRQAIARNKAMEVATGEFMQFLDADDYLEPDACECLYLYSSLLWLDMCQFSAVEFYHHNKKTFENAYHSLAWLPEDFPAVFNSAMIPNILPQMCVAACLTFYRRDFLMRNNLQWINKKIAYEDTPFFVESILKAKRVGAIKVPLYHRRVHSAATTQQIANNLGEYMEIIKYTLEIVNKLADRNLGKLYYMIFLKKVWSNFANLEASAKLNMLESLYNFFYFMQNRYLIPLPLDIHDWCIRYLKGAKKKKEKVKFEIASMKAKCIKDEYHVHLIVLKRKPYLTLSILGIPLLYVKIGTISQTETDKKNNRVHRAVFFKFCGLTLLKIQEIIYV